MAVIRELRKRAKLIAPPVLGACLAFYFVYHAVQGDRGLIAWLVLNQQIRGRNFFRGLFLLPWITSTVIIALMRRERSPRPVRCLA